jgi:hypothetical protein
MNRHDLRPHSTATAAKRRWPRRRRSDRLEELESRVEGLETLLAGAVQAARAIAPPVGAAMARLADEVEAERYSGPRR